MGFLLGGALSGVADGLEASRDKQQAKINQERELNVHALTSAGAGIQAKMAQLAPDDPNRAVLQAQLSKVNSDTTDLFHPSKDPGALQHFGSLIMQHVFGKHPDDVSTPIDPGQAVPATSTYVPGGTGSAVPGLDVGGTMALPAATTAAVQGPAPNPTPADLKAVAASRMADYQSAAAVPVSGTLPMADQQEASRVRAGIDAKAVPDKPLKQVWKQYTDPKTGKTDWYDLNDSDSHAGMTATPAGAQSHPSMASEAVYIRARFGDHPTAAQIAQAMQEHHKILHPETLTSHEQLGYDENGNPSIVQLHGSSGHAYPQIPIGDAGPAASAAPAAPAATGKLGSETDRNNPVNLQAPGGASTPGGIKARGKAQQAQAASQGAGQGATSGAGKGGAGRVTPIQGGGLHKNTPTQTKASTNYNDAQRISSLADDVVAHPNNAPQQKELAISLIKGMEGRFNVASYDAIVQKNGLGNSLEQWANDKFGKGTLPQEVVNDLVQVAKDNERTSHKARNQAYHPDGGPAVSTGMVTMRAPNGSTSQVSADQVEHYKSKGATVVQ